jgi:hypothetical protein
MNLNESSIGSSDIQWCFSQVKGTLDDDVTEGKIKLFLLLFRTWNSLAQLFINFFIWLVVFVTK